MYAYAIYTRKKFALRWDLLIEAVQSKELAQKVSEALCYYNESMGINEDIAWVEVPYGVVYQWMERGNPKLNIASTPWPLCGPSTPEDYSGRCR